MNDSSPRGLVTTDAEGSSTPRVVVGVDGSPSSEQALRWAVRFATTSAAVVHAVRAWDRRATYSAATAGWATAGTPRAEIAIAEDSVRNSVTRVVGADHTNDVLVDVVRGAPDEVLVEASRDATLLVLGARERRHGRGSAHMALVHHCVDHAHCPVLVVHAGDRSVGIAPPTSPPLAPTTDPEGRPQ